MRVTVGTLAMLAVSTITFFSIRSLGQKPSAQFYRFSESLYVDLFSSTATTNNDERMAGSFK